MRLATIDTYPTSRAAAVIGDEVLDLCHAFAYLGIAQWQPQDVGEILAAGDEGLTRARRAVDAVSIDAGGLKSDLRERGALTPYPETRLLAPLPRPKIVISCGNGYKAHALEMARNRGIENPKFPENPSGFIKNTNIVIGPGQAIILPAQCPDMVDYEAEFSIVIGRWARNVSEREAMDYIAGYTLINDVGARDWNDNSGKAEPWTFIRMGKNLPTFCPLGPVVATTDEVADPHVIRMTLTLNGEIMQDACTDDLIHTIPKHVSYFSRYYPLGPGDVISTGSPAGVGFARNPKVFMRDGDQVEITVPEVGTLRNPVRATDNPEVG